MFLMFCFNDTGTTEIYTYLHTLPSPRLFRSWVPPQVTIGPPAVKGAGVTRTAASPDDAARRCCSRISSFSSAMAPRRRYSTPWSSYSSGRYPMPSVKIRSEEHTSELQSLMRISYAVFCLKKKNNRQTLIQTQKPDTKEQDHCDHTTQHK